MTTLRYGGFTGFLGVLVIVLALALGIGGTWLFALGGSVYCVASATGRLLTGGLLLRSRWALWTFAALLAATLAWAVFEVQLDWWPLVARLDVFFAIGLLLLLPWTTGGLDAAPAGAGDARPASFRRGGGLAVSLVLVAVLVVGGTA